MSFSRVLQGSQWRKEVLSWYYFCLWLPHRKRDVGFSTLTRWVSSEMRYLGTKKKLALVGASVGSRTLSGVLAMKTLVSLTGAAT